MRILRLQLHELGRHHDLDLELAPGLTIIRGPNESGKSTIQRGLELALFRKPTATAVELETLRSWGIGDDDRSIVRLEFVDEREDEETGQIISRPGRLEKEFRGQRGRVSLEFDGMSVSDPARADQILAELTGIPTEAFFRSTASIRHEELDDLDRDEGALRDRLQASIGGGDRGSSRAKKNLEEAIRGLKSRGEKNPGRLKVAEQAVTQAEASVRAGEAALARLERDRDTLAQARQQRQEADAGLAESRGILESARQAERLRADRDVVKERYESYRQAADAIKRLRDLDGMRLDRSMAELREAVDRMRTYQARVAILQEALREGQGQDIEADEHVPPFLAYGLAAIVLLVVGAGLAFVGVGSGGPRLAVFGGAIAGVVGLYLALLALQKFGEARGIMRRNQTRDRERAIRRQTKVGNEEGLRVMQASVQNILRELGVSDAGLAEEMLANEQARRQEMETLRATIGALTHGMPEDQIVELRDQTALDLEQKTSALEAIGPIANDPRARERLEAEVRERQVALERARDAEAAAAARVEANPVDAEQVAGEAERLAIWREQLAALQRRLRIYELTLATIQLAERQAMRRATRFLEKHMSRDMSGLTGGRYRQVRVDDRTLDMEVFAPDRGDWIGAGLLSKGTVDQLFLAARIGLVRLVTEGRRPPLVLDDPFVTFDDARAARAALLLRELSSDFQVVYLACSSRYDGLADAVIELSAPAEIDLPAGNPAGQVAPPARG